MAERESGGFTPDNPARHLDSIELVNLRCSVCTAKVAVHDDAMSCHCTTMKWAPMVSADQSCRDALAETLRDIASRAHAALARAGEA